MNYTNTTKSLYSTSGFNTGCWVVECVVFNVFFILIHVIYDKALLGYFKRTTTSYFFRNLACIRVSYSSLVKSILEFGSVLWISYQIGQVNKLEEIQKRFVMAFKLSTSNQCNLTFLANRRLVRGIKFVY